MEHAFVDITETQKYREEASHILFSAFQGKGTNAWATIESALEEVDECVTGQNICIGVTVNDRLVGWAGLRPMYDKTWELQPMVIDPNYQGKGLGRLLLSKIEEVAAKNELIGIMLGTDDETFSTSISMIDITNENILNEIENIRNVKNHPFEFYSKCGYIIVGIVPNANGIRKPDIWMWKNLESKSG